MGMSLKIYCISLYLNSCKDHNSKFLINVLTKNFKMNWTKTYKEMHLWLGNMWLHIACLPLKYAYGIIFHINFIMKVTRNIFSCVFGSHGFLLKGTLLLFSLYYLHQFFYHSVKIIVNLALTSYGKKSEWDKAVWSKGNNLPTGNMFIWWKITKYQNLQISFTDKLWHYFCRIQKL